MQGITWESGPSGIGDDRGVGDAAILSEQIRLHPAASRVDIVFENLNHAAEILVSSDIVIAIRVVDSGVVVPLTSIGIDEGRGFRCPNVLHHFVDQLVAFIIIVE